MEKSTTKLIILIAIPIIMLAAFIISISWAGNQFYQYKSFKTDLAASIAYAQENNCLRADYSGDATRVNPGNAELIYAEITNGSFLIKDYPMPASEGILLDFSNDAQLRVWPADPSGIFIYFVTPDGREYFILTGEHSRFTDLERLVRVEGSSIANDQWSE